MHMTRDEAKMLVEIAKKIRDRVLKLPSAGMHERYKADDLARIRKFLIVAFNGKRNQAKYSFSLLFKNRIMLLRVDTNCAQPHFNYDGTMIPKGTPHIHIIGDDGDCHDAYPIPPSFHDPNDGIQTFRDFLMRINVVNVDNIEIIQQGGLDYEQTT